MNDTEYFGLYVQSTPPAPTLTGTELVPVIISGVTNQTTVAALAAVGNAPAILVESGGAAKISALPATSTLTGTELVAVVQAGVTSQCTTSQISAIAGLPAGAQPMWMLCADGSSLPTWLPPFTNGIPVIPNIIIGTAWNSNQSGNIFTGTPYGSNPDGLYLISAVLTNVTAIAAGIVTLTASWLDDTGTARTATLGVLDLTTTTIPAADTVTARIAGTTGIQYSAVFSGVTGSPNVNSRISAMHVG